AVAIGILERRHLDAVDDRFLVPTLGHTSTLGAASATSDAAPGFHPSSGRQQRAARSDTSWPCEEYSPRHSSSGPCCRALGFGAPPNSGRYHPLETGERLLTMFARCHPRVSLGQ